MGRRSIGGAKRAGSRWFGRFRSKRKTRKRRMFRCCRRKRNRKRRGETPPDRRSKQEDDEKAHIAGLFTSFDGLILEQSSLRPRKTRHRNRRRGIWRENIVAWSCGRSRICRRSCRHGDGYRCGGRRGRRSDRSRTSGRWGGKEKVALFRQRGQVDKAPSFGRKSGRR